MSGGRGRGGKRGRWGGRKVKKLAWEKGVQNVYQTNKEGKLVWWGQHLRTGKIQGSVEKEGKKSKKK